MNSRGSKIADISRTGLARLIDHTLLKPEATPDDIAGLCRQAKEYGFATVCVHPCYVPAAYSLLSGSPVAVCAVVGFPLGANAPSVKAQEAAVAVREGASEVDVVMNAGLFLGGYKELVQKDLEGVIQAARRENPGAVIKVILETCLLNEREKIEACRLVVAAGANFVKTSTGFGKSGATVQDVALLRRTVGPGVGVKASGGIRNLSTALAMVKAGADRLGTSSGVVIINEMI
ncbi:MAG: deoxyribose-phosphate aldolase [Pelotomaculaceae bacterium]|jgi:deoxyribose-phosphate aldolase|nr:deoxyribose-phosphate aldolase [Bacillota bacterium]HHU86506.1 deoxyribose-phosphate aldolase [Peptococcaceae bacterium]